MTPRPHHATRRAIPLWVLTTCLALTLVATVALGVLRSEGKPRPLPTTQLGPLAPQVTPKRSLPPGPGLPLAPRNQPTPVPSLAPLQDAVTALADEKDAKIGLAIVPVHRPELPASPPWLTGSLTTGPAWGTIAVPVATVALDLTDAPDELNRTLDEALALSDEDAVTALWTSLGTPSEASSAVRKELIRGGDQHTQVPAKPPRPGVSVPGQATWALADQATYISTLACTPSADPIITRMTQVVPDERWGLGQLPTTAFRGGTGADKQGNYTARQIGTLKLTDGSYVGVAIAAQASDGTQEAATALLSDLAHIIDQHASGFGGGC